MDRIWPFLLDPIQKGAQVCRSKNNIYEAEEELSPRSGCYNFIIIIISWDKIVTVFAVLKYDRIARGTMLNCTSETIYLPQGYCDGMMVLHLWLCYIP